MNRIMGAIGIGVVAVAVILMVIGSIQMVRAKKRAFEAARATTYNQEAHFFIDAPRQS